MLSQKNTDNNNVLNHIMKHDEMKEMLLVVQDDPGHKKSNQGYYYNGLYCLYKNNLVDAKQHLLQVLNNTDTVEPLYWKSLSFLGLVEVLSFASNGGLHRCYEALKECSAIPEVYLNIAYAEYKLGNRKRCVNAIIQCLELEPNNKQALSFYDCIGKRTRNNLIKNVFGKFMRRNKKLCGRASFNHEIKGYLSVKLDSYVRKITLQD